MAPLEVLGHGFGGSTFPELTYYCQKLITSYHPKSIVIYCENDLFNGDGKTVQQTFDDFAVLITELHYRLPLIPIFIVSLKPSPSRRSSWNSVQQLNTLIKIVCNSHKYLKYIDVSQAMFLPNGQIDGSLFVSDSLHLNSKGYALWTKVIKPFL